MCFFYLCVWGSHSCKYTSVVFMYICLCIYSCVCVLSLTVFVNISTMCMYINVCVCMCGCVCGECNFFAKEGNLHDPLRVPVGAHVTPQDNYILASPTACETKELAIFSVDIGPAHSLMTSKTTVEPHILSKNWHELSLGCCWRPFIKRVFDRLVSWDFILYFEIKNSIESVIKMSYLSDVVI